MAAQARGRSRGGGSPWAGQAAQQALLRYAPQREALQEALAQAQATYGSTVKAARVGSTLTKGAINAAIPATRAIYDRANVASQPGVTLLSKALAGANPDLQAGASAEVQQQIQNDISQRAGAEASLQKQKVSAREGAQFAEQSARSTLQETIANLISKGGRLSAQEGAAASAEADRLANQALDREQRERSSERSAATSTANSERSQSGAERRSERSAASKGASGLPPGVKPRTASEHESTRNTIQAARERAFNTLRMGKHLNYNEAYASIAKGSPELKDEAGHVVRPAIKGLGEGPLARAAVDLAYFGGIGMGTVKALHAKGFLLHELEYPVYHAPPSPTEQSHSRSRSKRGT